MNDRNDVKNDFPYLPEGREILFVPGNNQFMIEAKEQARKNSTDTLQPTGAVIVADGKIIGGGANHTLAGKIKTYRDLHQKGLCVRKIFNIPSGHGYWTCPGCVTNRNHAEGTAVRDAIKNVGADQVVGADLYLWGHWWCCETCWNAIVEAGIKNVYLLDESRELFDRASEKNIIGKQFK